MCLSLGVFSPDPAGLLAPGVGGMDGEAPVTAEWRAAVGGQFEAASHGVLDLGWRRGNTSLQLFTDTLDVRQQLPIGRGRVELGLRAAAAASGMWISPWTDGAPDPTRAQLAPYVGPDAHVEWWLPKGFAVGMTGFARFHAFVPMRFTQTIQPNTLWTRLDAYGGGYWRDGETVARLWLGLDYTLSPIQWNVSPHAVFHAWHRPNDVVGPLFELRGGIATRQGPLIATRLGGLTPYHPPLAGASWAEFWAEDFLTTRGGVSARPDVWHNTDLRFDAFVDSGVWSNLDQTPGAVFGMGGGFHYGRDRWFFDVASGYAPGLRRKPGVSRVMVFALIGSDWRPF